MTTKDRQPLLEEEGATPPEMGEEETLLALRLEESEGGEEFLIPPGLRPRTVARCIAFYSLYQFSVTYEPVERTLLQLWETEIGAQTDALIRRFAAQLAQLTIKHLDTIDRLIEKYARKRAFHRTPLVDLAILRLGAAEILYLSDVPPAATINEMVELAKIFGTEESPAFVNAVLDRIQWHRHEVPESEKVSSQWFSGASEVSSERSSSSASQDC
ncbi:MAG: hypothetical protein KatS3mg115_2309 [Candidatus Poribacteria bacterium]|nr:MAG: hypothetical protein KatS3mg115_2309 [Candidatus Poribacteria bacterium]